MNLRIGIICYPTVGGSGVVATELGKMLAERGHDIHFITSSMPFRLNKMYHNIFYHQVEVNQYSVFQYAPYDIALASKIAEVIKRENLHILHAHYAMPHAICAILGKQMAGEKVKIITTLHGTDITVLGYDPTLTNAIRFGIEHSDAVTAVSNALITQTDALIAPNKNIQTVYNFVDERIYHRRHVQRLKSEYGIGDEEKVLIHVSNFRSVKRVPDVVRAFSLIAKQVPARLLLVGDGPEMTIVCQLVKKLGLQNKVLFLGKQDNLEALYSISDLMLLLSEKESFGLAALEAMACGVPCIGTEVGGIPEVIKDGYNGFLCPLDDVEQVAAKALILFQQPALFQTISKNAVATVQEQFNAKKIVGKYESIYYEVMQD